MTDTSHAAITANAVADGSGRTDDAVGAPARESREAESPSAAVQLSDGAGVTAPSVAMNPAESQQLYDSLRTPPLPANNSNEQSHQQIQRRVTPDESEYEFPSILTCPINDEPPISGVRFVIPDANNAVSQQVFEYSALFCNVFTVWGNTTNQRIVRHPYTSATIERERAIHFFQPVSTEEQQLMHAARENKQLPMIESSPLTHADYLLMNQVHENVLQR